MLNLSFKFPAAVTALILQISAFACVFLLSRVVAINLTPLVFACACGSLACAFSCLAKQAKWWWFIQAIFAPALVLGLAQQIAPAWFLAAFLLMALVFWNTFSSQVPLYLSSRQVWQALENLLTALDMEAGFTFMDIGSGLGGVLDHLAKVRPDGIYHGVESAPLPFIYSWLRFRFGKNRHCYVQWGDFWDTDLADYDVVFAYLSPAPMAELWQKVKAEMKPGSIFISSTFSVPGETPELAVEVADLHHSTLLVWKL